MTGGRGPVLGTAIIVSLTVACAAPAAHATGPAPIVAKAACPTKVKIAGKTVCLRANQSCKRRYEAKYNSKGFTCKRNAAGQYRLKRMKQEF